VFLSSSGPGRELRLHSTLGHLVHVRVDPIHNEIDASPNSWEPGPCAAAAPRRGTVNRESSTLLADQRTTAVTLASIDDEITSPALCAQHAVVDLIAGIAATIIVRPGRYLRLLQDVRLTASSTQGAPTRDPTRRSSRDVARWQACRPDTIVEFERPVHLHQGIVVGERVAVVRRVRSPDVRPAVLFVAASLPGSPLASDHCETRPGAAMRSSQHPTRGDDRATAERHANVTVAKTDLPIPHALVGLITVHDLDARLVARTGRALLAAVSLLGADARCALEAREGQRKSRCSRCRHAESVEGEHKCLR